jgi:hypothetical protein
MSIFIGQRERQRIRRSGYSAAQLLDGTTKTGEQPSGFIDLQEYRQRVEGLDGGACSRYRLPSVTNGAGQACQGAAQGVVVFGNIAETGSDAVCQSVDAIPQMDDYVATPIGNGPNQRRIKLSDGVAYGGYGIS